MRAETGGICIEREGQKRIPENANGEESRRGEEMRFLVAMQRGEKRKCGEFIKGKRRMGIFFFYFPYG